MTWAHWKQAPALCDGHMVESEHLPLELAANVCSDWVDATATEVAITDANVVPNVRLVATIIETTVLILFVRIIKQNTLYHCNQQLTEEGSR